VNLPFALRWLVNPAASSADGDSLTISAGPHTDWFVDPGTGVARLEAPALVGPTEGDFLLSARVEVDFASTFDAGVLALWRDERTWAKLCFEYAPLNRPTVVSVVTRGLSDDCNSYPVEGNSTWLRAARRGPAFAFHSSTDGESWQLVRHFALRPVDHLAIGFLAQSPEGDGCTVSFDSIRHRREHLRDLRNGE